MLVCRSRESSNGRTSKLFISHTCGRQKRGARRQRLPNVYPHVIFQPRPTTSLAKSPPHNYFTLYTTHACSWVPRLPPPPLKILQWRGVYNHSHSLKFCHGSSLLTSPFTVHVQYMYTCIVGREYTLTASYIRDSAEAVHEAAATLGFTLKKEQEKVIVAFTQDHDVFVALPTGFGNSLCSCCLPYVFDKLYCCGGESW